MSGVYARKRSLSEYEFYNLAIGIKVGINKLAMRESVIPKRYRFTNAIPLIDMSRSAVYNITRSDEFYPNTSSNVQKRREYLTLAVADMKMLCIELQTLVEMGRSDDPSSPPVINAIDINKLEPFIDMAEREIALLKGARKNVKLLGKQTVEDRIRAAEDELERLRGLYNVRWLRVVSRINWWLRSVSGSSASNVCNVNNNGNANNNNASNTNIAAPV